MMPSAMYAGSLGSKESAMRYFFPYPQPDARKPGKVKREAKSQGKRKQMFA